MLKYRTLALSIDSFQPKNQDVIPVLDEDGKITGDLRLSEVLLKAIEVGRGHRK